MKTIELWIHFATIFSSFGFVAAFKWIKHSRLIPKSLGHSQKILVFLRYPTASDKWKQKHLLLASIKMFCTSSKLFGILGLLLTSMLALGAILPGYLSYVLSLYGVLEMAAFAMAFTVFLRLTNARL